MKNIKIMALFLLTVFSVSAQNRLEKANQSIKVNKDVTIDLNTSHTNIEVDTWSKDYVEVEAYIEGKKLSGEALKTALDNWNLDIKGTRDKVKITSKGSRGSWSSDMSVTILDEESIEALTNLPLEIGDSLGPLLEGLGSLESLKNLPEALGVLRIPESPDGNYSVDFDYDRYQKEGEKYLDSWSKKYRKEYGEEYEAEMREWAKSIDRADLDKFEIRMEKWGEEFGKDIEKAFEDGFGEDFEKRIEKWGEEFGKNIEKNVAPALEKWGEEFGQAFEARMEEAFGSNKSKSRTRKSNKNYDLIKTIKIKMPKKAKLELNVRHGELKMASVLHNVKADIAHGSLLTQSIDGSSTSINAAYSSVFIKEWKSGELNLKYVDDAMIQNVEQLMLNSISSTISLDYIKGNTIIDGSFGELTIHNILPTFNNLNIVLENSDAMLKLPKNVDYKLFFKGNRSQFNDETTSNKKIHNFINDTNTNNTIVVNAKYSNIVAK